jgi:hypothetical protein
VKLPTKGFGGYGMGNGKSTFNQVNIVVRDMSAAVHLSSTRRGAQGYAI